MTRFWLELLIWPTTVKVLVLETVACYYDCVMACFLKRVQKGKRAPLVAAQLLS